MNIEQMQAALALENHRRGVSREQFRKDLKQCRGQGGLFRAARKMVFGSYGRGLANYFNSKNVKGN